jgi:hypothetical protein
VVEGTVLHHENDDVLQIVESRGHSRLHSRCMTAIGLSGVPPFAWQHPDVCIVLGV